MKTNVSPSPSKQTWFIEADGCRHKIEASDLADARAQGVLLFPGKAINCFPQSFCGFRAFD